MSPSLADDADVAGVERARNRDGHEGPWRLRMVDRRPHSGGRSIGKPLASTSGGRALAVAARHPIATAPKRRLTPLVIFLARPRMTLSPSSCCCSPPCRSPPRRRAGAPADPPPPRAFAAMSNSSPTICSKGAARARAGMRSPPPMSPASSARSGSQPAGENGSWYQWVPLRRARLVEGKPQHRHVDRRQPFAPVSEYDARPAPERDRARRATSTPGMVFVGYGLSDTRARPRRLCRARRARQDRRRARRHARRPAERDRRPSRRRQGRAPRRRMARSGCSRSAARSAAPRAAGAPRSASIRSARRSTGSTRRASRAATPGSVRVTLSASRGDGRATVRRRAQVARRGPRRGRAQGRAPARLRASPAPVDPLRIDVGGLQEPRSDRQAARLRPAPRRRACRADGPSRPSRPAAPTPSRARTRSTMARSTMPPGWRRCSRRRAPSSPRASRRAAR